MRYVIDGDRASLEVTDAEGGRQHLDLYSPEAFRLLSHLWVKVGWQLKYTYGFTWMGRPIIQLPEDMVLIQEVIHRVRPDVIIETGVAHGGSLIFYASLCKAMDRGRVVGIDVEIRPHNRAAIEGHELAGLITLVEGGSTDEPVVTRVRSLVGSGETVLVLLDSNHSRSHVRRELELYAPLVTTGSYIVATDGVMEEVADGPRGQPEWEHDNPRRAALDFLAEHSEFELEDPPPFLFNEGPIVERVTHWPGAFLRRR